MNEIFTGWLPLSEFAVSHLPKHGDFCGVYAFRDKPNGQILKFGHTNHMRRRIIANYLGGVGGSTVKRIHTDLFENLWIERVEIAWIEAKDKASAALLEKTLRREYGDIEGKRPPWDLQW